MRSSFERGSCKIYSFGLETVVVFEISILSSSTLSALQYWGLMTEGFSSLHLIQPPSVYIYQRGHTEGFLPITSVHRKCAGMHSHEQRII